MPVIILTSSDQQIDIDRAYELAANSYLVKPSNPSALIELVGLIDRYWMRLNMQPTW